MSLVAYAVRIDLQCHRCSIPVSIAGHTRQVRCPGCENDISLAGNFLEHALSDEIDQRGKLEPDLFRAMAGMSASGLHRTSYGRLAPSCDNAACGRELPLSTLEGKPLPAPLADQLSITCPACQTNAVVRRQVQPRVMGHRLARGLLLEHRPATRLEDGGAICVWCPREGCGDAMGLTEYAPSITCDSCAQPFPLEREQWDRMITLPGAKHFYILIEEGKRKAKRRKNGPGASRDQPKAGGARATAPQDPVSFPLSPGWLVSRTLIIPPLILLMPAALLASLAQATLPAAAFVTIAAAVGIVLALMVAIRVPLLVYTLLFDRHLLLGKDELHVPILRLFQLRSRNIPFREIVTMTQMRKSGGSTQLVIAMRDGRSLAIPVELVGDRNAVMRAVQRRLGVYGSM